METVKNSSPCADTQLKCFQETGAFPLSFGFPLVCVEKAVSSFDAVAFRAEWENGRACAQVFVQNKCIVVGDARIALPRLLTYNTVC